MSTTDTRLQVMWNRLLAVVEEQGQALIRAAFSPSCANAAIFPPASLICKAGCSPRP